MGSMITCCHLSWNRLGCCRDSGWLLIRERKGVNGYVRADYTIMLWHKYHKYKHYKYIPRSLSEQGASAVQYGLTLWYKTHATRRILKTISVYYAITCSVHNRTCSILRDKSYTIFLSLLKTCLSICLHLGDERPYVGNCLW